MSSSALRPLSGALPGLTFEEFFADGISATAFSTESRSIGVASSSGRLSLLSEHGERINETVQFAGVRLLCLADNGAAGLAVCGDRQLRCFDRQLQSWWDARVTGRVTAIAVAPYGSHFAFATDGRRIHIVNSERKEIREIQSSRPVEHLHFLAHQAAVIAAAEYGDLSCTSFAGDVIWHDPQAGNLGMTAVAEAGDRLFVAAFNHGVQVRDLDGTQMGTFAIDGIPAAVACSATEGSVVIRTLEGRLFCLNFEGKIRWIAELPDDSLVGMHINATGSQLILAWESGRLCSFRL